jgi:hypothetical protein
MYSIYEDMTDSEKEVANYLRELDKREING